MNIDDFKKLKNARHKLENIIQKNDFDSEIENELKRNSTLFKFYPFQLFKNRARRQYRL